MISDSEKSFIWNMPYKMLVEWQREIDHRMDSDIQFKSSSIWGPMTLNEEEKVLVQNGQMIQAIKSLRVRYGADRIGLKAAKDLVDNYSDCLRKLVLTPKP